MSVTRKNYEARNQEMYEMHKNGYSTREISAKYSLAPHYVWTICNEERIKEAYSELDEVEDWEDYIQDYDLTKKSAEDYARHRRRLEREKAGVQEKEPYLELFDSLHEVEERIFHRKTRNVSKRVMNFLYRHYGYVDIAFVMNLGYDDICSLQGIGPASIVLLTAFKEGAYKNVV